MSGGLLHSRIASRCARRAHNDHDPTLSEIPLVEAPSTRWAEQGIAFEDEVVAFLTATLGDDCLDLRSLSHRVAGPTTADVMASGRSVIIGAALPDDEVGRRRGRPDLLISTGRRPDGRWGYLPGDIKSHQVLRATKTGPAKVLPLGLLAQPQAHSRLSDCSPSSSHRLSDLLQLAHYWRILEACGHASHTGPMGGLIGSDTFAADEPFLILQSLTEPAFTTFSRSRGSTKRSALERYDHEFGFRRRIVEVAELQGEPDAPDPLVRPIIIDECDSCPWHDVCLEIVGEWEPSVHVISGRLGLREWNGLRAIGISTVHELADLHMEDSRLDSYWPELDVKQTSARSRLQDAITRAQMSLSGERLRATGVPLPPVPRADVEVDFDLEWDADGRMYLWGMLVTEDGRQRVESVYDWDELDNESETKLGAKAIATLVALRDQAENTGKSFRVYHYSHPEISMVRSLVRRGGPELLPTEAWWQDFTSECFVDLLPIVKSGFLGIRGLGLKEAAQAAGFTWSDNDPGGEQSLDWIDESRHAPDASVRDEARRRLLAYNTDDVAATLTVREWLQSGNQLIADI